MKIIIKTSSWQYYQLRFAVAEHEAIDGWYPTEGRQCHRCFSPPWAPQSGAVAARNMCWLGSHTRYRQSSFIRLFRTSTAVSKPRWVIVGLRATAQLQPMGHGTAKAYGPRHSYSLWATGQLKPTGQLQPMGHDTATAYGTAAAYGPRDS